MPKVISRDGTEWRVESLITTSTVGGGGVDIDAVMSSSRLLRLLTNISLKRPLLLTAEELPHS